MRAVEKFTTARASISRLRTVVDPTGVTRAIAEGAAPSASPSTGREDQQILSVQRSLRQLNRDPTTTRCNGDGKVEEIARIRRVSRRSSPSKPQSARITPPNSATSSPTKTRKLPRPGQDLAPQKPHAEALGSLPERERMVLAYRFGLTGGNQDPRRGRRALRRHPRAHPPDTAHRPRQDKEQPPRRVLARPA